MKNSTYLLRIQPGDRWPMPAMLLALLLLSGCAGYNNFSEGKRLLQDNRVHEGLAQLEQALEKNPGNTEFKMVYRTAKERAIQAYLRRGDRMLKSGRLEEADQDYRQVLAMDPANNVAQQGLDQVALQRAQAQKLQDLRAAKQAGDWVKVLAVARSMLLNQADHVEALHSQQEASLKLAAPVQEEVLGPAFRKTTSLEFREAPLRQIFDALSRSSGLNFIFDKELNKPDLKASITLRDSTVELALNLLLNSNQLEMQVSNANTVLIYPATAAKLKDYQELTVRMFPMAYADAKFVASAIKSLFKGREPVVDEKLNMLVVRDTPAAVKLIEKLVRLYDVPESEVMLEMEILEVSRSKLLQLGVSWPDNLTLTPLAAAGATTGLTLNDLRSLNGGTTGASLGNMILNMSQQDDNVNVLANPRIRVVNKEKAKVMVGDRVPIVTVTTSPTGGFAENVTYVDVGLKLDVEPVIYRGSDISIKVGMEVSTISGSQTTKLGTVAYSFGTRNATTTLRLKDGETQVLAGLISDEDRDSIKKIPAAGELPVFGKLFGANRDQTKKTEIILSITPRLVRHSILRDSAELEFSSGSESRFRPGSSGSAEVAPSAPATAVPSGANTPTSPRPLPASGAVSQPISSVPSPSADPAAPKDSDKDKDAS